MHQLLLSVYRNQMADNSFNSISSKIIPYDNTLTDKHIVFICKSPSYSFWTYGLTVFGLISSILIGEQCWCNLYGNGHQSSSSVPKNFHYSCSLSGLLLCSCCRTHLCQQFYTLQNCCSHDKAQTASCFTSRNT